MRSPRNWFFMAFIVLIGYVIVAGPRIASQIAYGVTRAQSEQARSRLPGLQKDDSLSKLFAEVVVATAPSVVEVRVTKKVTAPVTPSMDQFLSQFFGGSGASPNSPGGLQTRQYVESDLGSGLIVDAEKGYVLTNNHVVSHASKAEVVFADGQVVPVEWVRADPASDLAVIKVDVQGLTAAPLGNSDEMQVGDWVLAFGAPEGLQKTVTAGIISAKGRQSETGGQTYGNYLQTDAAINPGNSGGPLVNMHGEVIGINSAIVTQGGGNEGIGLAIPSNQVKDVMTQLIEKGSVTRGYLGVTVQSVNEGLAKSFQLPSTQGALIASVVSGSPAAKAGLKPGDFIVSVNGQAIKNPDDLRNAIAGIAPGKEVPVEIYRDGKETRIQVAIGKQPAGGAAQGEGTPPSSGSPGADYGLRVETMTPALAQQLGYSSVPQGVVIDSVAPDSPAAAAGLTAGLTITEVDGEPVTSPQQFQAAVSSKAAGQGIRLRVIDSSGAAAYVFLGPQS